MIRISILVSCFLLNSAAYATDIYRWVDENGRTQISDTVPARYKSVATKIDTSKSVVSESQRQEAIKRAAMDKREADAREASRSKSKVEEPKNNTPAASASNSGNDDCAQLMKAYNESQACFAPFRMANGALKDGASDQCASVPDPSPKCGSPVTH